MTPRRQDSRFFQLLDQAKSGDEEAPHDLWINYRFDFTRDPDPRDQLPTRKADRNHNTQQEK
jgi:hypothetical protein